MHGSQAGPTALEQPLAPAVANFIATVDRIEAVVEAETAALGRNLPFDITAAHHRKRHGLLELSRGLRAFALAEAPAAVRERLGRLGVALERNRRMLDAQLCAVREITDIIAHAIKEAESDGTYCLRANRQ